MEIDTREADLIWTGAQSSVGTTPASVQALCTSFEHHQVNLTRSVSPSIVTAVFVEMITIGQRELDTSTGPTIRIGEGHSEGYFGCVGFRLGVVELVIIFTKLVDHNPGRSPERTSHLNVRLFFVEVRMKILVRISS